MPQCMPRDVLVRDVNVTVIASKSVCAQAVRVAEARRGVRLPLGPRGRLALLRDDLERDVEARLLIAREPDGARSAAAERAQGTITAEYEAVFGDGLQRGRHPHRGFGHNPRK